MLTINKILVAATNYHLTRDSDLIVLLISDWTSTFFLTKIVNNRPDVIAASINSSHSAYLIVEDKSDASLSDTGLTMFVNQFLKICNTDLHYSIRIIW